MISYTVNQTRTSFGFQIKKILKLNFG